MQQTEKEMQTLIGNKKIQEKIRSTSERMNMENTNVLTFDYTVNGFLVFNLWGHRDCFRVVIISFPKPIPNEKQTQFERLVEDAFRTIRET